MSNADPAAGGPQDAPSGQIANVRIEPHGWQFEAARGLSLRDSAERAGILLPSACRNGTCRECLCRLRSGEVRYEIAWPGLSLDEKREGWILPCVARPVSDELVIEAPRAKVRG